MQYQHKLIVGALRKMKKYYEEWRSLSIKRTLYGSEALEAVKRDGHALRYVKEEVFIQEALTITY